MMKDSSTHLAKKVDDPNQRYPEITQEYSDNRFAHRMSESPIKASERDPDNSSTVVSTLQKEESTII